MHDESNLEPRFTNGTVSEHILFVVSLCRFQHHSLGLASVHYLTWSAMHVGLYVIALSTFGVPGAIALCALLVGWALRMDLRVGLVFAMMELGYATVAHRLFETLAISPSAIAAVAFGGMVASLIVEVASHVLFQGYKPAPPAQVSEALRARQKLGFALYFVVAFGLFFLTLDLAMRLLGYRASLHRRANAFAREWHRDAARGESAANARELAWHLRAIDELV